jgi:hypothetical protein
MDIELTNLIKQLVKITQSRVVFVGSFVDTIRGFNNKARDIDIIVKERDLDALKELGEVSPLNYNPMFKGRDRYFIKNKVLPIDVFVGDGHLPGATFDEIPFDDVFVKVYSKESEIQSAEKLVEVITPIHKGTADKYLKRANKLKLRL